MTLPCAALIGALLGLIFGLPSMRLRGLYLAISTLGLHFVMIYLGGEYEARQSLSTGVMIDPPSIGGWSLTSGRAWYAVLLSFAALALLISVNLKRTRTGRAWRALRERDVVAGALGIDVQRFQLMAFVVSATMTAIAGALFAYFRNFVSIDAFSLYLTVQYVAMIIIGGMGSIPGALLGAALRHSVSLCHRGACELSARTLQQHGVRARLRGVRSCDDSVPAAGAGRTRGALAPAQECRDGPPRKVGVMTAASANTPLLAIEALEVAYHRTAVALHGISLKVMPQTIVAVLGNNGAGKTTTRAISGFIGIDDARVTGGRIAFAGKRIENQSPHANTARGIVLVPERDKVFPNLTVAENLIVAASHRANAAEQSGGHRRLYRHAAGRLIVRLRQRSAYCAVRLATAAKAL